MATNRSQIYIDTIDNTSSVLQGISRQVQALQSQMAGINGAGINRINSSLTTQTGLLTNIRDSISNMPNEILSIATKWASVYGAISLVKNATVGLLNLYKDGVQLNIDTETTKIGIAGLMATVYKFQKDTKEITGMDKLNTALVLSETIMKRLRVSAIQTGASFDEVADAFRNAVGGGARLNIGPERLEKLSTLMANATKGFGLDKGQTGQETRAIFQNKIDRSSTVGNALQIGPGQAFQKQYQEAFNKGGEDFAKFLEDRLIQFNNAGKVYANTLGGIFDQMSETYKLYKSDIAKGMVEELSKLKTTADSFFKDGDFTEKLDGVTATLQSIGQLIAGNLVESFNDIVNVIFEISDYLENDQTVINGLIETVGLLGDVFGSVFDIVGSIGSLFLDVIDTFATLFGITTEEGKELDGIQTTVKIITGFVGALNFAFGLVKDTVKFLADSIRLILGASIDYVLSKFKGFIEQLSKVSGRLGLENVSKDLEGFAGKIEKTKDKTISAVLGSENRLLDAVNKPNGGPDIIFADTIKALDKSAAAFDKASQKENNTFKKYLDNLKKNRSQIGQKDSRLEGVDVTGLGDGKNKEGKGGGKSDSMNAILKSYEDELKAFLENNNFKRKENDLLYSNFKKNIKDYYNFKTNIDEEDYRKQQETYQKELDFLATQEGTKKNDKGNIEVQNKILEITTKKNNAEKEYNLRKQETLFNLDKELKKQEQSLFNFKAGIDDLLGNSFNSNKIKLKIEIENLNIENQQNPEMLGLIKTYSDIKEYKLEQEQLNQMLSLSEEKLNILRENGSLTQIDYFKQLGELNAQRLAQYEDEVKFIKALAPDEQDNLRLKELENLILKTRSDLDPLAKDIKKTFQESFGTFFSDVISGTKSIKDAFKDLVSSISNYLSKLVSEKLAQQIFGGGSDSGLLGGLLSSGGSGSSGGGFADFLSTGLSAIFGGGKATGGFTEPGKFYKWNENGDEMFFSNSGGYVMNASRTNDLLRSNQPSVINVNTTLATPNYSSFNNSEGQVGAMISTAIRKAQRNL